MSVGLERWSVDRTHAAAQDCTYATTAPTIVRTSDSVGVGPASLGLQHRGNCYDNAVMESFFNTLKVELGERFESAPDAERKLFDYIEVSYNGVRIHTSIGFVSPRAFERAGAK